MIDILVHNNSHIFRWRRKLFNLNCRWFRAEAHQSNYYERFDLPSYTRLQQMNKARDEGEEEREKKKKTAYKNAWAWTTCAQNEKSPFSLTQKTNQVCNKTTQYYFDDNIYVGNAKQTIIKYWNNLKNHIYSRDFLFSFGVVSDQHLLDCRQNHPNNVKLHMISIKPKGFFCPLPSPNDLLIRVLFFSTMDSLLRQKAKSQRDRMIGNQSADFVGICEPINLTKTRDDCVRWNATMLLFVMRKKNPKLDHLVEICWEHELWT